MGILFLNRFARIFLHIEFWKFDSMRVAFFMDFRGALPEFYEGDLTSSATLQSSCCSILFRVNLLSGSDFHETTLTREFVSR